MKRRFSSPSSRPPARPPCADLDDALISRVVGRIVAHVPSGPGLHGEAGKDFPQLGGGVLCLLVVACPGVGGGEEDIRIQNLRVARDRLLAPWNGLFPLGDLAVEDAHEKLPRRHTRVARAQSKRGLDPREAVLGAAEIYPQETGECMGDGVVTIVGDRFFRLRDRRPPLVLTPVDQTLSKMSPRILRLKGQGGVDRFLGARNVACGVVAPLIAHATS
jgi:hypothetical protein